MIKEILTETALQNLARKAREAAKLSYSPYSRCAVGAALLTTDGEIFLGTNIENAAYSPTLCAERAAFANAITGGKREFAAIAVYGEINGKSASFPPCGVCRQFMSEFCDDDFVVLFVTENGYELHKFGELLPHRFSL